MRKIESINIDFDKLRLILKDQFIDKLESIQSKKGDIKAIPYKSGYLEKETNNYFYIPKNYVKERMVE